MSAITRIVWLLAFWLLAWGEISTANVVSGVVLAAALLVAFPPSRRPGQVGRVSAWGTMRLVGYVLVQLDYVQPLWSRGRSSRPALAYAPACSPTKCSIPLTQFSR